MHDDEIGCKYMKALAYIFAGIGVAIGLYIMVAFAKSGDTEWLWALLYSVPGCFAVSIVLAWNLDKHPRVEKFDMRLLDKDYSNALDELNRRYPGSWEVNARESTSIHCRRDW